MAAAMGKTNLSLWRRQMRSLGTLSRFESRFLSCSTDSLGHTDTSSCPPVVGLTTTTILGPLRGPHPHPLSPSMRPTRATDRTNENTTTTAALGKNSVRPDADVSPDRPGAEPRIGRFIDAGRPQRRRGRCGGRIPTLHARSSLRPLAVTSRAA